MKVIKFIFGIIGVTLGALGVILAVVQIISIWSVNPPLTNSLQDLTSTLQDTLVYTDNALNRAGDLTQELRSELAVDPEDAQQVVDKFNASLTTMRTTVESAGNSVYTLQAMVGPTTRIPRLGSPPALAQGLDRAALAVENAERALDGLEQQAGELATATPDTLSQLDAQLASVQTEIDAFRQQVLDVQPNVLSMENSIPWWIDLGSGALTLLFFWGGVAQLCLLLLSWRWVRHPGA